MHGLLKGLSLQHLDFFKDHPHLFKGIMERMQPKQMIRLLFFLKDNKMGLKERMLHQKLQEAVSQKAAKIGNGHGLRTVPNSSNELTRTYANDRLFGDIMGCEDEITLEEMFLRKLEFALNTNSIYKIIKRVGVDLFNNQKLMYILSKRGNVYGLNKWIDYGIIQAFISTEEENNLHHKSTSTIDKLQRSTVSIVGLSIDEGNEGDGEESRVDDSDILITTTWDIQDMCFLVEYVDKLYGGNHRSKLYNTLHFNNNNTIGEATDDIDLITYNGPHIEHIMTLLPNTLTTRGKFISSCFIHAVLRYCWNRCNIQHDLCFCEILNDNSLNNDPDFVEKRRNEGTNDDEYDYYIYDLKHNIIFTNIGTFFKYNVYDFGANQYDYSRLNLDIEKDGYDTPLETLFSTTDSDIINRAIKKGFSYIPSEALSIFVNNGLMNDFNAVITQSKRIEYLLFKQPLDVLCYDNDDDNNHYGHRENDMDKENEDEPNETRSKRRRLDSNTHSSPQKIEVTCIPVVVSNDNDILTCDPWRLATINTILSCDTEPILLDEENDNASCAEMEWINRPYNGDRNTFRQFNERVKFYIKYMLDIKSSFIRKYYSTKHEDIYRDNSLVNVHSSFLFTELVERFGEAMNIDGRLLLKIFEKRIGSDMLKSSYGVGTSYNDLESFIQDVDDMSPVNLTIVSRHSILFSNHIKFFKTLGKEDN